MELLRHSRSRLGVSTASIFVGRWRRTHIWNDGEKALGEIEAHAAMLHAENEFDLDQVVTAGYVTV